MQQLLLSVLLPFAVGAQFTFSTTLSKDSSGQSVYELRWTFDAVRQTIAFNVQAKTVGWVGLGLSPDGGMVGSDVVTGWVNSTGAFLQDRYADSLSLPSIDPSQDWTLLSGNEANGWTNLTFTRKWITGDSRDRDIMANTARVVFSWGDLDPVTLVPQYHGSNYGSVSLNLLGGLIDKPALPSDARNLTLAFTNVTIPRFSTTYWCTGFKLPDEFSQKRYVIRYSPIITSPVNNTHYVHHILLYLCTTLNETTDLKGGYDCDRNPTVSLKACRRGRIVAGWAAGGEPFVYPEGIAYGLGGPSEKYLMLEIHYNNPKLDSNILDSSGFSLVYTSTIPVHEAAIFSTGSLLTPHLIVPPNATAFTASGRCTSECTTGHLPPTGITVFGSLLHTHLAGVGVTVRHMRWNTTCGSYQELPNIDQNLHYDFNLQQTTLLLHTVTVLPGDALWVDCKYNTASRSNLTFGGEATTDEMCVAFLSYYPRTDVVACGSTPHPNARRDFVSKYFTPQYALALKNLYATAGSNQQLRDGLSEIYGSLQWNQQQIADFEEATNNGYFVAACYEANGTFIQSLQTPPAMTCNSTSITTTSVSTHVQGMNGLLALMLLTVAVW